MPGVSIWYVVLLAALVVTWLSVLFLLSIFGGWRALAKRYPAGESNEGTTFSWRSGSFGGWDYSYCLRLRSGPAGLRIAVHAPFRPSHPPLFVPWQEITATQSRRLFFFSIVTLRFVGVRGATLGISEALAGQLAAASRDAFRISWSWMGNGG
jgi:hypothetical protein